METQKEKTSEKTDDTILRNKAAKLSVKEGFSSSLMEGFGNRYISPYAISLGANNFQIGLLSSLPGLLGNLFQLPILFLMKRFSRKKIVITSVLSQAILWLPLIVIGFLYFFMHISSKAASNLLIIAYSLMIIAGTVGSPAWNSWMKDIVVKKTGEYFGKRNVIINIALVLSMLISGLILNFFGKESAFTGFLIIFFIAFLARSFAAFLFTKQYEPEFKYDTSKYFSIVEFIKKMATNNFGRFVILVSLVNFATAIAGPFFAVYQLKDLNLSYISYTIIILSNVVATIVFMPIWGKFADKYGNVKVLRITGFLIPLVPFMYLITILLKTSPMFILVGYVMLVEAFSGFAWAGFNLSSANFIYDAVTRERMAFCIAYFNLLNAFGTFIGALLGGLVLNNYGFVLGVKAIFVIFFLSGFLRLMFAIFIAPRVKEVRDVLEFDLGTHIKHNIKENIEKINVLKYIGLEPNDQIN